MNNTSYQLIQAEEKAKNLFGLVQDRGLIKAGKTEMQLCKEIEIIALEEFGVHQHWGKKLVRAGVNTTLPYSAKETNQVIQEDDILFFDFHPVFDGWEADLGRTFVLGNDPIKHKLKNDVEEAWYEGNAWYNKQESLTGKEFYQYAVDLARSYGYEFGNVIAGHIIGKYPHEQPDDPNDLCLDVHADNFNDILGNDKEGNKRHWMLELHFVHKKYNIGAFFEQLITSH